MVNLSAAFKKNAKKLYRGLSRLFFGASGASKEEPPFQLYQPDGYIHVFTDGSHSLRNACLGMGWVVKITDEDELLYFDRSERISGLSLDKQNIAAEIMAVTHCLQLLPAAARVKLHTDLGDIINFVDYKTVLQSHRNSPLNDMWEALKNELDRHAEVKAVYANDKDGNNDLSSKRVMRLAHNLAALASGANTQKRLVSEEDDNKYGYLFDSAETDPDYKPYGSTPGALDIR